MQRTFHPREPLEISHWRDATLRGPFTVKCVGEENVQEDSQWIYPFIVMSTIQVKPPPLTCSSLELQITWKEIATGLEEKRKVALLASCTLSDNCGEVNQGVFKCYRPTIPALVPGGGIINWIRIGNEFQIVERTCESQWIPGFLLRHCNIVMAFITAVEEGDLSTEENPPPFPSLPGFVVFVSRLINNSAHFFIYASCFPIGLSCTDCDGSASLLFFLVCCLIPTIG